MAQSECQIFEIHSCSICPLDSHVPGRNTDYIESYDHDAGSRKIYQHVQEQEEQVCLDSYQESKLGLTKLDQPTYVFRNCS